MPRVKWISRGPPKVNHLAATLRAYKLASGMSSEEIGKALGCSADAVRHQLGRPAESWKIGTLKRYCDVLHVPYSEALEAAGK